MFLTAGCAHQGGSGRVGTETGQGTGSDMFTDMRGPGTTENLDRNPSGAIRSPSAAYQYESPTSSDARRPIPDSPGTITAVDVDPYQSSANAAIQNDPNWNPSDDLLRDGISSETEMNVGGAARGERGSASSDDLNTSSQLEENISGEFSLDDDSGTADRESKGLFDYTDRPQAQVGVTGNEPEQLFNNNRAQGVGSAATGEFGVATSRDPLASPSRSDQPLEERVKAGLVRDTTGAHGLLSSEVARNIEITAHDGVVTLRGSVPSEKDRRMVEVRAAEISGVKHVVNELVVNPAASPAKRNSDVRDESAQPYPY
jgi:osmotically-inducible protein OsmY